MNNNFTSDDQSSADRLQALAIWTNELLEHLIESKSEVADLVPVSGDASFRRYFRVTIGEQSFIAVDAPPEHEDNALFVRISNLLLEAGITAPKVYSVDYDKGFMLLVDLGDLLYLPELLRLQNAHDVESASRLYQDAFEVLYKLQSKVDKERLDPFSKEKLIEEMELFTEWFCKQYLDIEIDVVERRMLDNSFDWIAESLLKQEQVAVHRDFHARNLMLVDESNETGFTSPGVIDFQDAVSGPYTYDLVSLVRDCYIAWPTPQVEQWAETFLERAQQKGLYTEIQLHQFIRDLNVTGLQRNLKVMGIFSRLFIRDKKSAYLADIPLVIRYFSEVTEHFSELAELRAWFTRRVLPSARDKLELE